MDLIYIPSLEFREFEKFEKKKKTHESLNNFESPVQKEEKHHEISWKLEANCKFNNNQPGTG